MSETANLSWFANAKKKYLSIFEAVDQDRVRGDLHTFFGPRSEMYLAIYEKMRGKSGGFVLTWNWTVFVTVFPWFFYRKMYAMGAAIILMPVVLGYLIGTVGNAGSMVAFALVAKTLYVQTALGRLQKADALNLVGAERDEYLRRAGGVSVIAGVIAGILFAALMGLVIFSVYVEVADIKPPQ